MNVNQPGQVVLFVLAADVVFVCLDEKVATLALDLRGWGGIPGSKFPDLFFYCFCTDHHRRGNLPAFAIGKFGGPFYCFGLNLHLLVRPVAGQVVHQVSARAGFFVPVVGPPVGNLAKGGQNCLGVVFSLHLPAGALFPVFPKVGIGGFEYLPDDLAP